jgi:CHAT domain-containing protein
MLIFSEDMPSVIYSPTLLLFKEQKKAIFKQNSIQMGAFSASFSFNSDSSTGKYHPPKLNHVTSEIENILQIFGGKAFVNSTKEQFLKQANEYNILHLAMHSTINDRDPEHSSINFYGDKNNRLLISELYNETLNADMVTLSSCNTGSGLYENGEGVISLSRAFTFSGIPSVVMSLWKIPDKQSATIMQLFYKNLKKGQDKAKALKQAKLDYLNSTEDTIQKHPYYWAGYVISGDTSPIVSLRNYYLWGLISIGSILLFWLLLKYSIHLFK